jgi:hypothetical protein
MVIRRDPDTAFKAFVAVWITVLLLNLVVWGVAISAVIEMVQWVKTK